MLALVAHVLARNTVSVYDEGMDELRRRLLSDAVSIMRLAAPEMSQEAVSHLVGLVVAAAVREDPSETERGVIALDPDSLSITTSKPSNLIFDMRGLLTQALDGTLEAAGVEGLTDSLSAPLSFLLVGLLLLRHVRKTVTIELSPHHGALVLAIWMHDDPAMARVPMLAAANTTLRGATKGELDERDMERILSDLVALRCVKEGEDGWELVERVKFF